MLTILTHSSYDPLAKIHIGINQLTIYITTKTKLYTYIASLLCNYYVIKVSIKLEVFNATKTNKT